MGQGFFQGKSVESKRVIYTPSVFARNNLFHLQEVGILHALKPHTSSRSGLQSFLFFTVLEGSGQLFYHSTLFPLKPGDCVFIDCSLPYSQSSSPNDLWTLSWIHFFGPSMIGIYEKYLERGGLPTFTPDDSAAFSNILSSLLTFASTEDHIRDMKINEKIASLLTLIMSESWHPENVQLGQKRGVLRDIKRYIDEHFSEKITLDLLANKFYINKFYLTRKFKEQYGTTLNGYLENRRITEAKKLLRFSNLTSENIGRSVGFHEPGYFNRVFKKVEGINPGEYRKLW